MKIERSRSNASSLTEKIEITRDTPPSRKDPTPPSLQDKENPLHALAELVERLEALEELQVTQSLSPEADDSSSEQLVSRQAYMSQVDHYLTLFQKQSAVLRKLSNKLN